MMKNTYKSPVKGTELVTVSKATDWALVAYMVHPNYTTNLPTKLHSLIFNTLESMADSADGLTGWRKFAECSPDTKADMGCLVRIMLENVKISSFLSLRTR